MPDMQMCSNDECPLSRECYRFLAFPSEWQVYGNFDPKDDGTCDHFIELEPFPDNLN